jgi:hypothetical protein
VTTARRCLALAACLVAPALARPGGAGNPCSVTQPWPGSDPSYASVVNSCAGDRSFGRIAMDDWTCAQGGVISGAKWWGTTNALADKPQKWFYIAMRAHTTAGSCTPALSGNGSLPPPIQSWCVQATASPVGADCDGRQVYEFKTCLIPPFIAAGGVRYWFQVSEIDQGDPLAGMGSVTVNEVDFRWSGYTPQAGCQALQFFPNDTIRQPLDYTAPAACAGPHDLAFELYDDMICGNVPPPPPPPPGSPHAFCPWCKPWKLNVHAPLSPGMKSMQLDVNEDGFFAVHPDLPPGLYDLSLYGPSAVPVTFPGVPLGGDAMDLGPVPVSLGDADGNDKVNFSDITAVLANFGAGGP